MMVFIYDLVDKNVVNNHMVNSAGQRSERSFIFGTSLTFQFVPGCCD